MTARAGIAMALLVAGVAARAQCPTWQELKAEESISTVDIGAIGPRVGVSVAFIYLNPRKLGECVLGAAAYETLTEGLLRGSGHGFWVGASGPYASAFKADHFYLVQADRKLEMLGEPQAARAAQIPGAPEIKTQYLIFFRGALDFRDPVTIFFQRGEGTYGSEYWLNEQYMQHRD